MTHPEDKTRCALEEHKYIEFPREDFLPLVRPAKHFCKHGGRFTVDQEKLCNPLLL